ncbi:MAG: glycosyltransferase family 4 protein [Actinomycetota bacterium]|nr:glycosyltransferase family 4 protein [Actinomycetota bacterium]
MRVQLVDPPAYSPPYDYSLAGALARAGAEVELLTSRHPYGPPPPPDGFRVREDFYRRATARERSATARRALRVAEHLPDMLRQRRTDADVVHYQWLTLEAIDAFLMAGGVPRVFTSHNVLRRGSGRLRERAARLVSARADAIVAHTDAGARALVGRFGADPQRVHMIPHGAFDYLARQEQEAPLPADLAEVEGPVVLCFGIVRPYKGVDVLVEAFREIEGAELWVVGRPWMSLEPLVRAAGRSKSRVRFVERFVSEPEIPAFFRRADLVVLPYRRIDQSGVLYTALAFGKAMVLSDVGGFSEIGRVHGAARLVPPEDPAALRETLAELLADPAARAALEERAAGAAAGPFSWDHIGRRTLALYEELRR